MILVKKTLETSNQITYEVSAQGWVGYAYLTIVNNGFNSDFKIKFRGVPESLFDEVTEKIKDDVFNR